MPSFCNRVRVIDRAIPIAIPMAIMIEAVGMYFDKTVNTHRAQTLEAVFERGRQLGLDKMEVRGYDAR
jgi:hypothetical protein